MGQHTLVFIPALLLRERFRARGAARVNSVAAIALGVTAGGSETKRRLLSMEVMRRLGLDAGEEAESALGEEAAAVVASPEWEAVGERDSRRFRAISVARLALGYLSATKSRSKVA
jgi:hypothetical protein